MRVLLSCDFLRGGSGGIRQYVEQLAANIACIDGVNLTLLAYSPSDVSQLPSHLDRIYLGDHRFPFGTMKLLALSPRMLRSFDVFHVPHCFSPILISRLATTNAGAKLVVTCHDLIPLLLPEYRTIWSQVFDWVVMPRYFPYTSCFLANSYFTKNEMMRHWHLSTDRIMVTWLGARQQITECAPTFNQCLLVVASFEPRKNLERTIRAFLRFAECHPEFEGKLRIVGECQFGRRTSTGLALENLNRIEFLGHVSTERLVELYQTSCALLYLSYYEGFGLPVVEAMSFGCPVIAAHRTSIPEVGGQSVLYVDPFNENEIAGAIAEVVFNSQLRAKLADRGIERAKQFSWQACATQTVVAYRAVLS